MTVTMIDISDKPTTRRTATAEGWLMLRPETLSAIVNRTVPKGDVLTAAQLAGIQAVKSTPVMLALCHPIPLNSVNIHLEPELEASRMRCECRVTADYKTGVEMEALFGVTIALLSIWDMVKSLEKDMRGQYPDTMLTDIRVVTKTKEGFEPVE